MPDQEPQPTPEQNAYARMVLESVFTPHVLSPRPPRSRWICNCPAHRCSNELDENTLDHFQYVEDIGLICQACYDHHGTICAVCSEWGSNNHTLGYPGIRICPTCVSRETRSIMCCGRCNRLFVDSDRQWTTGQRGNCARCSTQRTRSPSLSTRHYTPTEALLRGKKAGKTMKSLRAFGVELEVQWHEIERAMLATEEIRPEIGIGRDSSINGNGMELQTPPARGLEAETMIRKLCGQLLKHKFTIDKSCGMHIHLDVPELRTMSSDQKLMHLQNIWCMYLTFEDVILSFLPKSRRGNTYAASLKADYHFDEVWKCQTLEQLERLWYRVANSQQVAIAKDEHRHRSRYRGINLHPLLSAFHLEIRYHSGTMISRKILEWANLHCLFVDKCLGYRMEDLSKEFFVTDHDSPRGENWLNQSPYGAKTEFLFDFLGLSEESKGYFRARQAEFFEKLDIKEDAHFKSGVDELQVEKEN